MRCYFIVDSNKIWTNRLEKVNLFLEIFLAVVVCCSRFNLLCIVNSKKLLEIDLTSLVNLFRFYLTITYIFQSNKKLFLALLEYSKFYWWAGQFRCLYLSYDISSVDYQQKGALILMEDDFSPSLISYL